jgi:integrase
MPRKKITGLIKRGEMWHINKQILGVSIRQTTGTDSFEEAELVLAKMTEEIRQRVTFGARREYIFREGATRYLEESMHLKTISDVAWHFKMLDPFIGDLPLKRVHGGTLKTFIDFRRKGGVKNKTINESLGCVRRVLNRAARLWRDDDNGRTWLETAPLIQFLNLKDARKPSPMSWDEQRQLFQLLPSHLAEMCLFKVNTGTRESEVCNLRWDSEVEVPDLKTSVFMIPENEVKNGEERLVVLNDYAKSVIESVRGRHPDYVFTYKGKPISSINNTAWQRARVKADLVQVRVHDLKHTFGRRLRAAGVSHETRQVLLGHKNGDITSHYSAPEVAELINASNKVCADEKHKSRTVNLLKRRSQKIKAVVVDIYE